MLEPWTLVIVKWQKAEFLAITDEYVVGWVLDDSDFDGILALTVTHNDAKNYYAVDIPKNQIIKITTLQSFEEFDAHA